MAASPTLGSVHREVRAGKLKPVYYLTGPEDVLKDELARAIVDSAVDPASRDFNFDLRAAGDLDGETLHTLVETPPLLAERRVVHLKYLEQWRRNAKVWQVLERYVGQPSPTTVLIISHRDDDKPNKLLAAAAFHLRLDPLSPSQVNRWIERRAADNGFAMEKDAADLLQQAVGGDLMTLSTEIRKLATAIEDGSTVTAEQVAALVGVRVGETPEDWVLAVINRDTGRAVGVLDGVLGASGVNGVRLIMQLGGAFVGIRLAKALIDSGAPVRKLPWQLFDVIRRARGARVGDPRGTSRRWADAAQRWTSPELDHAIRAARDADEALKSTTVTSERGILIEMVLKIGRRKAAA